jgi:hypothetical protein
MKKKTLKPQGDFRISKTKTIKQIIRGNLSAVVKMKAELMLTRRYILNMKTDDAVSVVYYLTKLEKMENKCFKMEAVLKLYSALVDINNQVDTISQDVKKQKEEQKEEQQKAKDLLLV